MPKFNFPLLSKIRWRQLSIAERGAIAINIPLVCLFLSLGTHVFLRQATLQSEQKVEQAQNVLKESRALLLDMLNAETGVRGYRISRQPEFLEPFNLGVKKLPQTLDRLKLLVKDHPKQRRRVETLDLLSSQKLQILKDRVDGVQNGISIDFKTSNVRLLEGKRVMDNFRNTLAEFEVEEELSLRSNHQRLQQLRDLNILLILISVAISAIGAPIAAKLFKSLAQELSAGELMLQESNSLIQAVFENVVDGVLTLDSKGQIKSYNQAASIMFGYEKSALIGQNWTILLGTESQNLIPLPSPGKIKAGDVGHLWQTMGQRNNGDYFPIEISISKIEVDNRQIAIVRDITLRQQTEAKLQSRAAELVKLNLNLRRTNDTLAARNQELDRFAYVTSHDLKAPLRAIANLASWIAEDLEGELLPENQNQLRLLQGRVNRMEALLDGLLEYSRIGRKSVSIELTNVHELVIDAIESFDPNHTFKVEIAADLPIFTTRRLLLKQVFTNLIDNAIEHHPRHDGKVKITGADRGDRYEFAVTDDGEGIEPQYHEKIYTIFQTLQARDTHESTGVGLAIVKKIVETEGGTIGLKSALGQGATFSFTWLKQPIDSVEN